MVKASKAGKINPYLLFIIAAVLMSAGFLMGPFPVLIFAGVAPLFAIADHADGEHFWNKLELVGVALAIALFSAHFFRMETLVGSILQAIALTIGFAAFGYTRQALGARLGKLPLIFFILTIEYLMLKGRLGSSVVFLADSIQLKPQWIRWTQETGYLGVSFWILVSNLLLYLAIFRGTISIPFLVMFVVVVAGPIIYSYTLESEVVKRQDMVQAYTTGRGDSGYYFLNAEWIPRTATWVSALILLFAFVKSYTKK